MRNEQTRSVFLCYTHLHTINVCLHICVGYQSHIVKTKCVNCDFLIMKNSGNVLMHTELEYEKNPFFELEYRCIAREQKHSSLFSGLPECFVFAHIWYCFKLRRFFIGIIFTKHSPLKSRLDTVLFAKFCVQQATLVVFSNIGLNGRSHSTSNVNRVEMACDMSILSCHLDWCGRFQAAFWCSIDENRTKLIGLKNVLVCFWALESHFWATVNKSK